MRAMRACFLVIALALGATACGGEDESSAPTTAETTTTMEKATTSTVSGCDQASESLIDAIGTWLDRVEVDPEAASEVSSTFSDLSQMGAECGEARSGSAMSKVVVYLAKEESNRPGQAGAAAGAFLSGLCGSIGDAPFELTSQGQTACIGTGNGSDSVSGEFEDWAAWSADSPENQRVAAALVLTTREPASQADCAAIAEGAAVVVGQDAPNLRTVTAAEWEALGSALIGVASACPGLPGIASPPLDAVGAMSAWSLYADALEALNAAFAAVIS